MDSTLGGGRRRRGRSAAPAVVLAVALAIAAAASAAPQTGSFKATGFVRVNWIDSAGSPSCETGQLAFTAKRG
jgi:hypothetical protein